MRLHRFPAHELSYNSLFVFIAYLERDGHYGATIKSYVSAVRSIAKLYSWKGWDELSSTSPSGKKIDDLCHSISLNEAPRDVSTRPPLRFHELGMLYLAMGDAASRDPLLREIIGFTRLAFGILHAGGLRIGDLAKAQKRHVTFYDSVRDGTYAVIKLYHTKTSRDGKPKIAVIVRRNDALDVHDLLRTRCSALSSGDDYLIPLERIKTPGSPSFCEPHNRAALASKVINTALRHWLLESGCVDTPRAALEYSSHCFRHGITADYKENNVEGSLVRSLNRWSEKSKMPDHYGLPSAKDVKAIASLPVTSSAIIR